MSHGFIFMYMNTKKTLRINIPNNIKTEIQLFIGRSRSIKTIKLCDETVEYLKKLYESYGFKVIARELDISYTQCRRMFMVWLNIKTRVGQSVCLDTTKKFRRERVIGKDNPWYDWPGVGKIKNSRGIQGYYRRKDSEKIWLRSTWEYIYAKWLDLNNINWTYEGKQFTLSNGESYRPDFTISENGNSHIVELKGYFKNRLYKVQMLKNEYPDIKITVIDDIKHYTDNYRNELKLWKIQIKLNA